MTGLVPRADYDRVVRERDALAEENAWLRSGEKGRARTDRRTLLRKALPGLTHRSGAACVERLIDNRLLRYDAHYPERSQVTVVCEVRKALRRGGFVGDPIRCVWGEGHYLTDEARAWLRQTVPDAFPQPGGPSR